MRYSNFLVRVADRAGLPNPDQAEPPSLAVLTVLGERLSRLEAEALADDLCEPLAGALRGDTHGEELGLAGFYARVAEVEHVRPGMAVEHAIVVLQTLAEEIRPEVRHRLELELPRELSELLTPPEPLPHLPPHLHRERRTLAEGRPGSQHPLAEAGAERAHQHSVVRSENPHGDTKLSSARGLTQEREGETLAEGKPGSSRPVSEGK